MHLADLWLVTVTRISKSNMSAINAAFVYDEGDDARDVKSSTNQIESSDIIISNDDTTNIAAEDTPTEHQPSSKLQTLVFLLRKRKGLFCALLSAFLFSSEDVLMDVLAETMDVFQITSMVGTLTIIFSGVCLFFGKINPPNGNWQWISLVISGVLLALGMPTALLSLKYMDVGASIALIYTLPIFTGIFGWIILKEPMKLIHVLFVAVSLAGVIFIAQPEFIFGSNGGEDDRDDNLLLGTVFALVSAVAFALLVVVSRKQTGAGMHLFVLMFYNAIFTSILNAVTCTGLKAWERPTLAKCFEILGFATIDFVAQICLITALMWEAAILVSIATTSEVLCAFIWQISIFRVYPDWKTGVGAFLIVSTCVGIALSSSEPERPADTTGETQKDGNPTGTVTEALQDKEVVPTMRRDDDETSPPLKTIEDELQIHHVK